MIILVFWLSKCSCQIKQTQLTVFLAFKSVGYFICLSGKSGFATSTLKNHRIHSIFLYMVVTKTWNHPKPPKTIQNYPKPPTTTQKPPKTNKVTQRPGQLGLATELSLVSKQWRPHFFNCFGFCLFVCLFVCLLFNILQWAVHSNRSCQLLYFLLPVSSENTDFVREYEQDSELRNLFYTLSLQYRSRSNKGVNSEKTP